MEGQVDGIGDRWQIILMIFMLLSEQLAWRNPDANSAHPSAGEHAGLHSEMSPRSVKQIPSSG